MSATLGGVVVVGGSEADGEPAVTGLQDGVECGGQAGEVAVVDPVVVELLGQLRQRPGPVASRERRSPRNLDVPVFM